MDYFSLLILVLAAIFLWWVIKERGRNERERQVSVELVNRLFRLDERILKLETEFERRVPPTDSVSDSVPSHPSQQEASPADFPARSEALIDSKKEPALGDNPARASVLLAPLSFASPTAVESEPAKRPSRSPGPIAPAYINGSSTLAGVKNGAKSPMLQPATGKNGQGEAPKLGEIGMAALLCGIAMLTKDEQGSPKNTRE
jgi:hypothetical protein